MNVIMQLLQSRKNLQVGAGAAAGGLVYLIPVFAQLLGADKVAATIQHTADVMAVVAVLLGAVLAFLTAIEDCARKLGVTVPPQAEVTNQEIATLKKRFDEMALFMRGQILPGQTSSPVKE